MPNSVKNNKNYPLISKSIEMHQKAKKIMHPVSQTLAKAPGQFSEGVCPVFVEKAKGNRIWDIDGNEFLDYYAAIGPISLGYGYEKVDEAIKNQLDKGITFYRDYLYISGRRLSSYEHFKYEDWNYFIYNGVLYTKHGSIYNGNALACNSSQTGPVKCVSADSNYTDGNVYKYHTNNNKNDTAKTGFEGVVYYERDIRYAGKYCKSGKPYHNFKQVTDYLQCRSFWGSSKVDGPFSWQSNFWSFWNFW